MKPNHCMKCTPLDRNVARIQMVARRGRKNRTPQAPVHIGSHLLSILTVCVVFGIMIL